MRDINTDPADGHDVREDMPYLEPFRRVNDGECTKCRGGKRVSRTGLIVTKMYWAGMPLGYLLTECADHHTNARNNTSELSPTNR